MKKFLLFALCTTLFSSCMKSISTPLKGNYETVNKQFHSTKSNEIVWSNIIDLFAKNGIAIQVLDKSSGLITTSTKSFIRNYTFEDANGKIINPNAYFVVSKEVFQNVAKVNMQPSFFEAGWNIHLKNDGSGGSIVDVNVVNLKVLSTIEGTQYTAAKTINFEAFSLGNFEKSIFDAIK